MTEILIDRTGQPEVITASDGSLTVTVPICIKRRGSCKVVTLPDGVGLQSSPWDNTPLQLALARGQRWLALLESGEEKSMKEIARREGVDDSYVSRMVNLTTLAPDIVAAIFDETLPAQVTLFDLAAGTPLLWEEQGEGSEGALICLDPFIGPRAATPAAWHRWQPARGPAPREKACRRTYCWPIGTTECRSESPRRSDRQMTGGAEECEEVVPAYEKRRFANAPAG